MKFIKHLAIAIGLLPAFKAKGQDKRFQAEITVGALRPIQMIYTKDEAFGGEAWNNEKVEFKTHTTWSAGVHGKWKIGKAFSLGLGLRYDLWYQEGSLDLNSTTHYFNYFRYKIQTINILPLEVGYHKNLKKDIRLFGIVAPSFVHIVNTYGSYKNYYNIGDQSITKVPENYQDYYSSFYFDDLLLTLRVGASKKINKHLDLGLTLEYDFLPYSRKTVSNSFYVETQAVVPGQNFYVLPYTYNLLIAGLSISIK